MTFSIVTSFLAHPSCSNRSLVFSSLLDLAPLPAAGLFLRRANGQLASLEHANARAHQGA